VQDIYSYTVFLNFFSQKNNSWKKLEFSVNSKNLINKLINTVSIYLLKTITSLATSCLGKSTYLFDLQTGLRHEVLATCSFYC
jgi:hypothetical protein